eukprot:TRINITY_DN19021_c0_g2_i1.p1 TRINITY_DN19021_c0_g2~~TRINITY_DN19021_c0_g2_i1.p1  ORF type:complete len:447 (+),score=61.65 TRINITY_DN19021_c0_g2_i1:63-1403(+)
MSIRRVQPSAQSTVLPLRLILVCCLCDSTHYYAICSLFSYAGVMTADLGWALDRDHAGFIAGFLASASLFGRTVTSSIWGFVAARFGYKKAILVSFSCIAIGGVAFAFSSNLYAALAARFVFLGAGNGWVAMMSPLCMELAGPEKQADLLGIVMSSSAFTQLFGPAVAGYTYGVFEEFPAALPSLLGTVMACLALTCTFCWLSPSLGVYDAVKTETDSTPRGAGPAEVQPSVLKTLCTGPMPLIAVMRFLSGMILFAIFEVVPLWLIASKDMGGMGFEENDVGNFLARSAVWNIIFFSYIMPESNRRFGPRKVALVAGLVSAVSCATIPFVSFVPVANFLHALTATTAMTTGAMSMIHTNNASPPDQRSKVNGIIGLFETAAKALGPIGATNLFAWTNTTWGVQGQCITFAVLAALLVLFSICAACLPTSVDMAPEQSLQPKDLEA